MVCMDVLDLSLVESLNSTVFDGTPLEWSRNDAFCVPA